MAFEEPEIRTMFPIPLVNVRLKGADSLNERLLAEIAERRKSEPGIDRSNRYGWHSALDLFQRAEPAHADLAAELDAIVASAGSKLIPDLPEQFERQHEGWVNVNPTHAMNAPHDHAGMFWSGCYYVKVPPPAEDEDKLSGAIEFIDPRGSLGSSALLETPFTRPKFTARPANGACLLWPSFVKHWVHPNRSDEERVTVAFNSWYVRRAASASGGNLT
jgi:uncharacterized protein (TIGR02466 family)